MVLNYESEIENKIVQALTYKYQIYDDSVLYRYLILRYKCVTDKVKIIKKRTNNLFIDFLLTELMISELIYKNVKISLVEGFDNSLINIINNWKFRFQLKPIIDENKNVIDFNRYINNIWNCINSSAKKNTNKKTKYYNERLAYYRLVKLDSIFGVIEIKNTHRMDGFVYNEDIYTQTSLETKLERYVHASNFETNILNSISEEEFEDYLYKHLNKIEEGLRPIDRQVIIKEGRIDILAKDKDNEFVILELKITNDKHLIWQVLYYPEAMKEKLKEKDIRMITVCPFYPEYLLKPLKKINNVELVQYRVKISNHKIKKIEFKKIK